MIDGIGGRLPLSPVRTNAVASSAPAAPAQGVEGPAAASSTLSTLTRDMAASPPVDTAKVDRVKAAIGAGTYAVEPARIADAMIAHDLPRG